MTRKGSVVERTAAKVAEQHLSVIEGALEKLVTKWPLIDLVRIEHPPCAGPPGTIQRSAIRHAPSGFDIYAVETTCDESGYHTRGWIPENGRLLDHGQEHDN